MSIVSNEGIPHVGIYDPDPKYIKAVLCKSPCFIEADDIQLTAHIDSGMHLALGVKYGKVSYFCGLIQNIFCLFNRESAKFVPIVNVAGRAGGTTIVIKSRALTIINFRESCGS